jgi:hypothetical protein
MRCFKCGEEITQIGDDVQMMIPIERPVYGNLNFHKNTCYQEIKGREIEYLTENYDRIIATLSPSFKEEKTKKTKRK